MSNNGSENGDGQDFGSIVDGVVEREQKNRQALAVLLTEQQNKQGHLLALRASMGTSPTLDAAYSSYITSVSLNWVADQIKFAGDLPIFTGKVDPDTKQVPVDELTVDDIQQRQPDWSRQLPMAVYLATRRNHKFPPLLVVGYQEWVYDPTAEEWGPDKRAMRDSVTARPLLESGDYCDLDTRKTNFFALDGQHRLMAIMGLKELLTVGQLPAFSKDRKPKKSGGISRADVVQSILSQENVDEQAIQARLTWLMDESIGIEIIPAVCSGETWKEALFRLRRVFVDVNERAKHLTRSETIALDEDYGFRVVARQVVVGNQFLKSRVDQKAQQLSQKSEMYSTLKAVTDCAIFYLGGAQEFAKWKVPMLGKKELGFIRPDEGEMADAANRLDQYFNCLAELPSHRRLLEGKEAARIRDYQNDGEDNILFRPHVQLAFAEALSELVHAREMDLESLVAELGRQEDKGQLKLTSPKAPWLGVLCDPATRAMHRKRDSQRLCSRLLVYLLGGGIQDDTERERLRADFARARVIGAEHPQRMSLALTGKEVLADQIKLPPPWR